MLLVEPSAYAVALTSVDALHKAKQARKAKVKKTAAEKAVVKEWAVMHGVKRGGHDGNDDIPAGRPPTVDACADDEGLLAFVQSVTCRRKVWAEIFECGQKPGEYAMGIESLVVVCRTHNINSLNRTVLRYLFAYTSGTHTTFTHH